MEQKAKKNLGLLSILAFLFGFRAFEGVIAVYFAAITGSFAVAMSVLAIMNLSASFFEIPTGIFSDHIGRKKTLIIYYFSGTLAILLYYLANSSTLLILGSIITGFSMAMRSGAVSAFVYENLEVLGKEDEFQKQEGHRQALGRYALVVSGIIGTAVIFVFDIRAAVLLTLLVLTVALLLSFRLSDIKVCNPKTSNIYATLGEAWKKFRMDKILRDLSIGRMINQGGGNVEYRFRALFFAVIVPEWLVNLFGILNNFISGLSMKYSHKIVGRFGFMKSLVHAEIFDRITTTVFVVINSVSSAFAMNAISGVVFGVRQIASEDLLQTRYSKDQRATMGSIVGLGGSLVYGILGIAIGFLADGVGVINTMLILQPILILSSIFFYRGIKNIQQETKGSNKQFKGAIHAVL